MKTVGQMLREKRLEKRLTIETVEQETKIRHKYLLALEEDNFQNFPSQAYLRGFIKNYSEYLGLSSRNMMAFYRRQTEEISKVSILPKKPVEPLQKSNYILTPGRFLLLVISILGLVFFSYFGFQYRKLQLPPHLTLESPQQNTVTTAKRIDIIGETDADSTVSLNGINILVRSDGKFFDQVQLFPGKNTIRITATSRYGKSTTIERNVESQEDSSAIPSPTLTQ